MGNFSSKMILISKGIYSFWTKSQNGFDRAAVVTKGIHLFLEQAKYKAIEMLALFLELLAKRSLTFHALDG